MSGSDVKVFEETMASAPPRNAPRASRTMSVVDGVSLAHTGIFAISFTTLVTMETSSLSLPTFDPMSGRSMWRAGQVQLERIAPLRLTRDRQFLPVAELGVVAGPAMIDATST